MKTEKAGSCGSRVGLVPLDSGIHSLKSLMHSGSPQNSPQVFLLDLEEVFLYFFLNFETNLVHLFNTNNGILCFSV